MSLEFWDEQPSLFALDDADIMLAIDNTDNTSKQFTASILKPFIQATLVVDVNADSFNLSNLDVLTFANDTGALGATDYGIVRTGASLTFNVGNSLDSYFLNFNGTNEYTFDSTKADFKGNNIIDVGTLNNHTIPGGTDTFALLGTTQTFTGFNIFTQDVAVIRDGASASFNATTFDTDPDDGAFFDSSRARGTQSSPLAIQADDIIGGLNVLGHDGTDFEFGGFAEFVADGTWTVSSRPTRWAIWTTASGSTTQVKQQEVGADGTFSLEGNNIVNLGTLNNNTIPAGTDTFAMLGLTQTFTGVNTFTENLTVLKDNTGEAEIRGEVYNNSNEFVSFEGFRARGSLASPTALQSGDFITDWVANGHDGVAFFAAGLADFLAADNWSVTSHPTSFEIATTDIDSIILTRQLKIDSDGTASFEGNNVLGIENLTANSITYSDDTLQTYAPTLGPRKDISTLVFNQTVSLLNEEPVGLDFSPDGLRYFISGFPNDLVTQFDLSTAWDISTGVKGSSINVQTIVGSGVQLRNLTLRVDGTKLYVADTLGNRIYELDLSTPFDISTASFTTGQFKDVTAQTTSPATITFNGTGTRMFVFGSDNNDLFQYDLSIPWNVTTAVFNSVSQDFTSTVDPNIQGVSFTPDGRTMYLSGNATNTLYQYNLPTPWDITIIELETSTFDFSAIMAESRCVCFKPDFTKCYLISFLNEIISEFDVGLKIEGNIARAGHVGAPSILGDTNFEIFSEDNLNFTTDAINSLINLAGTLTGYTDGEDITLSGGSGTGATASAVITGGTIQSVTLISGGENFTVSDTLTITGVSSTTATATIDVDTINDLTRLVTGVYDFRQNMNLTRRIEGAPGANVVLTSPNGAVIAISFFPTASDTTFLTTSIDTTRFATQNIQFFLFGTNTTFIDSKEPTLNINDTQVVFLGSGNKKIGSINNIANNFSTRDSVFFNYNLGMDIDAIATINANGVFGFSDGTGTDSMWNISSSIAGTLIFDRGIVNLSNAGESFVNLDSGITNKITIQDIQFTGIGSFYDAGGLDQTSIFVRAFANDSPDSMIIGGWFINGNTNVTDIVTAGVFVPFNLDTAIAYSENERFTLSNATTGELTYDGLQQSTVSITGSLDLITGDASAKTYNFKGQIDTGSGFVDLDTPIIFPIQVGNASVPKTFTQEVIMNTGDKLRFVVAGIGTVVDITVSGTLNARSS